MRIIFVVLVSGWDIVLAISALIISNANTLPELGYP